jgi:hypothetical protein
MRASEGSIHTPIALVFAALGFGGALGAMFYQDGSAGGCGGNLPGSTSIQAAVNAASEGVELHVKGGTYTPADDYTI